MLKAAKTIIADSGKFANITTVRKETSLGEEAIQPVSRIVNAVGPVEDAEHPFFFYFATKPVTRKVRELKECPFSTITWTELCKGPSTPTGQLNALGIARPVPSGPAGDVLRERHWQPFWANHYSKGPLDSPDYMLFEFVPYQLEFSSYDKDIAIGGPFSDTWEPFILRRLPAAASCSSGGSSSSENVEALLSLIVQSPWVKANSFES
uniref:Pyridoxamine 5'-phosphate oxidase putative domain-containing protein n=1 Tax=Chromera velia CCMP2878 TaxID=1169474 RepID=A0A0G4HCJ0_9ALVE|eukprot:Cvel_26192.t1-p1 / transcript=Cvel_26192.t1 / gene=Cvel_26192 / organism=Chromera_velia_CCMP2878 / gene_product=hypothetical protein / transcript_product=hypothetical protein / location=Cvel_scaffold3081:9440-12870(-) / protein_length=207 / sequence_SO=supercontig / SO=protein_coding / is_pseudo=false